jgi:hypothetical protein
VRVAKKKEEQKPQHTPKLSLPSPTYRPGAKSFQSTREDEVLPFDVTKWQQAQAAKKKQRDAKADKELEGMFKPTITASSAGRSMGCGMNSLPRKGYREHEAAHFHDRIASVEAERQRVFEGRRRKHEESEERHIRQGPKINTTSGVEKVRNFQKQYVSPFKQADQQGFMVTPPPTVAAVDVAGAVPTQGGRVGNPIPLRSSPSPAQKRTRSEPVAHPTGSLRTGNVSPQLKAQIQVSKLSSQHLMSELGRADTFYL